MSKEALKSDGRGRVRPTMEYRVYFAIVFILALPIVTVLWFYDLLRGNIAALHHGIVGRALSEASVTTPKIFSA